VTAAALRLDKRQDGAFIGESGSGRSPDDKAERESGNAANHVFSL